MFQQPLLRRHYGRILIGFCALYMGHMVGANAAEPKISKEFAEIFVSRIQARTQEANRFMQESGIKKKKYSLRGLSEGEVLILDLTIPPRLLVEGTVVGEIKNQKILVSLRDFITTLNFPIEFDEEARVFSGWFIREDKTIEIDLEKAIATRPSTDQEFVLNSSFVISDDDVLVPLSSIEQWFDMEIDPDLGTQRLVLNPIFPLPATERFERRKKEYRRIGLTKPIYPEKETPYDLYDTAKADVSIRNSLRKPKEGDTVTNNTINLRTSGELLYGVLNTSSFANQDDGISSIRANYLRESNDPDLFGKLKARRFELGDLSPTRLPITGSAPQETGVRITNTDPLVNLTFPSTNIEGYFTAGWDVELYRDNSLLLFQETDENGFYSFQNIPLLASRNAFRLIAYGPQGEIEEESLNIPYDRNRLSNSENIYDVSLTAQNSQLYRARDSDDEDEYTPHLVGFYEMPLANNTSLRFGGRYRQEDGANKLYANTAISTTTMGALINADLGVDEQGEIGSQLVINREFGQHRGRYDFAFNSDGYSPNQEIDLIQTLSNRINIEGPSPINFGDNMRYSFNYRYDKDSDGETAQSGFLGLNTQFGRIGLNQAFDYSKLSRDGNENEFSGLSSVTGSMRNNTVRALARYNIKPNIELDGLTAFIKRRFNNELEGQFQIDRTIDSGLMRYSSQVNYRPYYATFSPRITLDNDGNKEVALNTRFSLAKPSEQTPIKFSKDYLTNLGSMSAFVYLDKNGNSVFDGEDEPIEEARIQAPHNSGGDVTDKNGIAYVSQMRPNIKTDIFLDSGSLPDPFWISGREGISITPLQGKNIELDFPVHIAGELDGTVYKSKEEAAKNLTVSLYHMNGKLHQKTITGPNGFYIFSLIKPGSYYIVIEDRNIPAGYAKPMPNIITVGYEGTILYGQDIFLDQSNADVAIEIAKKESFSDLDKSEKQTYASFLNFGSFNSKLGGLLTKHKLSNDFSDILPKNALEFTQKDNQQVLRIKKPLYDADKTKNLCRYFKANGIACKIEIVTL